MHATTLSRHRAAPRRALYGALAVVAIVPLPAQQPPADLGLPVYPGARFEPQASAQLSGDGEQKFYVYLSDDPIATVVHFYEQRTAKRAESYGDGMYGIAVRGKMPFPELGLTVQPNTMYRGSAKSVITLTRRAATGERKGQPDTVAPAEPDTAHRYRRGW